MADITLSEEALQKRQKITELRNQLSQLFEEREHMITFEKNLLIAQYTDLIGKLQYEKFVEKVAVMKLKRKAQLMQASINRGEHIVPQAIEQQIDAEFAEYQQEIEEQIETIKAAKSYLEAPLMSEDDSTDMKQIYRLLVKCLHPDWNPEISQNKKDLFIRVQAAYKACDVQELRNILLMLDAEDIQIKEKNIDDDILRLEKSIDDIKERILKLKNTFPFTFREQLDDQTWIKRRQSEIHASIQTLKEERMIWETYVSTLSGGINLSTAEA